MNIVNFNIRTALLLLVVLTLSACATPLKSFVDVADQAEFGELRTYAWITDEPMFASNAVSPEVLNPLNEQRIRTALEEQLENKGSGHSTGSSSASPRRCISATASGCA